MKQAGYKLISSISPGKICSFTYLPTYLNTYLLIHCPTYTYIQVDLLLTYFRPYLRYFMFLFFIYLFILFIKLIIYLFI